MHTLPTALKSLQAEEPRDVGSERYPFVWFEKRRKT